MGWTAIALPWSGNSNFTSPDAPSYSTGSAPHQQHHRQRNRLYRQMHIVAARRELSRSQGQIYLAPGYIPGPRCLWLRTFLHLRYARGTPLVQHSRRRVVAGQDRPSRHLGPAFRNTLELLFGQHLRHPVPRRPWTDQDLPPVGELHNLQRHQLRIAAFATP